MKGVDGRGTRYGAKICPPFGHHNAEAYIFGIREFLPEMGSMANGKTVSPLLAGEKSTDYVPVSLSALRLGD
jgi:hypothetical protein